MKRVFAFLLFLMLPIAPLGAQGLHRKILLLQDSNSVSASNLKTAVRENYGGNVDSEYALPPDLSSYDAILMVHAHINSNTIPFSDQLRLIDYIKNGGKLYWEGYFFITQFYFGNDSTPHPFDTLASFIGLKDEGVDAVEFNFVRFFGVDSEFTNGFVVGHSYDPVVPDDGTDFPRGNFISVLYGEENDGALYDAIAWIPADTSLHAMMHHALYYEYYAPFLTRVLCDYFDLGTDAVQEQHPTPSSDLRVVEDANETWLVVSGQEEREVDIVNTLGATIFHCIASAGGEKIAVPANLPSGVYFARLLRNGPSEMRPFVLIQK